MGILRRKVSELSAPERGIFLTAEVKIGRDADNDLQIARPSISGRHATLRWNAGRWVLRDISTHGTIVNQSLVRGASHPLSEGDEITFVEADEVWTLVDASPPGLLLRPIGLTGSEIHVDLKQGLRGLPSSDKPTHTILHVDGTWFLEREGEDRQMLVDDALVELFGAQYRVVGASVRDGTQEPENPASVVSLDNADLTVTVLRGEDEAELAIVAAGIQKMIKPSRPLYLVAYLAEHRMKDRGAHPAAAEGWISADLACTELNVDRNALNVDVFRVREAVRLTGVANAGKIIERRAGQIRLGVAAERCSVRRV